MKKFKSKEDIENEIEINNFVDNFVLKPPKGIEDESDEETQ
jgi:hypothetical protein